MAFRRAAWFSVVSAAWAIAFAHPAIAQVGATIGYASDYRLRGVLHRPKPERPESRAGLIAGVNVFF